MEVSSNAEWVFGRAGCPVADSRQRLSTYRRRIYNYQRGAEAFRYETDGQRIVSYRRTGSAELAAGNTAAAAGKVHLF